MQPKVSILLPHYQTPRLTLLCLRLIRRQTVGIPFETIVIDNGSADGSGDALRQVRWIRLYRREVEASERPARSHGLALNFGLERAAAPFVLTMHTDTMILRPDWLVYLASLLESRGENCVGVGSWKMESQSWLRRAGKWVEQVVRNLRGRAREQKKYLRSHCALYRKDAVLATAGRFEPSNDCAAGEELQLELERAGGTCCFLAPHELGCYVRHLNHATMALNESFGERDRYMPRTRKRAIRRIESFFQSIRADHILADSSLDA